MNALSAGHTVLGVNHLGPTADAALGSDAAAAEPRAVVVANELPKSDSGEPASQEPLEAKRVPPTRAQLVQAVLEAHGNLSAAARALALHRTQLRRHLEEYNIDIDRIRQANKS